MKGNWLVVGIAGATCSGKTTLAKRLKKNLGNSIIVNQDEYFLPPDDPRHILVPEVNHFNWELLTSLDMDRMLKDIRELFESTTVKEDISDNERRILILDGFVLFKSKEIAEMCDLRYFLELNEKECSKRRKLRVYDPPDVPNYFEKVVWPEYVKSRTEILTDKKMSESIVFIDGSKSQEETFSRVFNDVQRKLSGCK